MNETSPSVFNNPCIEDCCALLKRVKTIAVVGLSPNASRPSYGVSASMQGFGFRVIPVHPTATEILGEKVFARLSDITQPVDLVNVFRQAEFIDDVVDECLKLNLKNIWIQEGIVNPAAAQRAIAGGMTVVMDRCIYRDYRDHCR